MTNHMPTTYLKRRNALPPHVRGIAVLIVFFLLGFSSLPEKASAATAEEVGVVSIAVLDVFGRGNNQRLGSGDALFYEERIITGGESAVRIDLLDESVLSMGENSSMVLDFMVYQTNRGIVEGSFTLASGVLHFKSAGVAMDFSINTPMADIGIRGTEFDVLADDTETEVSVQEGAVVVSSQAGVQVVTAGQSYAVDADGNTSLSDTPSVGMTAAVTNMLATLSDVEPANSQSASSATSGSSSQAETQQAVAQVSASNPAVNVDNLLVMEMDKGLIFIEMLPHLAPNHVARVTELVSDGAYDGQTFDFVRHGYAAETGQERIKETASAMPPLAAEITDTPFVRGTVGMSRLADDPDSANGAFFITLGEAPSLDQSYTVWGRVVYGMDVLDTLSPGRPPANPDAIGRLRLIGDMLAR